MAKFPRDAPKQRVVKALESLGFRMVREHEHLSMVRDHADGTHTPLTMPNHRRMMARELAQRGSALILAGPDRDAAQQLASQLKCRFVQWEALYTTIHDVLIVCAEEDIHPGYLRPSMTVMDLTASLQKSQLLREAEDRGCVVIAPRQLWLEQTALQTHLLTGKDVPRQVLAEAASRVVEEE